MSAAVHLACPPNIARHLRNELTARFPKLSVAPPPTHREMFDHACRCGEEQSCGLTISAYPQVLHNIIRLGSSRFADVSAVRPRIRSELDSRGLDPLSPHYVVIALIPCVMACGDSLAADLLDWEDLCAIAYAGRVGVPPNDTPLPYMIKNFFLERFGNRADHLLSRIDTSSPPLDINKRIASGDLIAGVVIPAFGRSFRGGGSRMIWPKSGSLAIPLIACVGSEAPDDARAAVEHLLSPEVQTFFSLSGWLVPMRDGISGFPELQNSGWTVIWPGWKAMLQVSEEMKTALLEKTF